MSIQNELNKFPLPIVKLALAVQISQEKKNKKNEEKSKR